MEVLMTPEEIIAAAKRVLETETEGLKLMQASIGDSFVQYQEDILHSLEA